MKRFYKEVTTASTELGWTVSLDGRPIKTQGGQPQVVPSEDLAEMLAAEWREQGEEIDPSAFRYRDMTDYALDVIARDKDAVVEKLLGYAETDTLCYRANPEEALYRRQQEVWEPIVAGMEAREGVALHRISGILHRPQTEETLAKLRSRLEALDAFTLTALEQTTSLAASLCIGLEALEDGADGEALWDAANLEEDWQADLWGRDEEAEERRAKRKGDFLAAIRFARAA
ncbi:ATP12 family chaperone protein [Qipengyuania gelatinilytica]|uniref:Molecular chaperone n=1 Tax=Qipengyuania gelatinilytica TaxID=2867231 RepID=A0ABX9A4D2_9SPHN|nr:ATP12 family protein [Qipengyuania gelatinilytica]QZD94753.1 molecular chaperone [Qipengyuania gelatinilytica]